MLTMWYQAGIASWTKSVEKYQMLICVFGTHIHLLGVSEYSKRECIEISSITTSVDHRELEPSVCKFLQHIGVDTEERIESCHYINRFNDRTILKLCSCNDCKKLMSLKSELNNLVSSDIGLSKAFHNESFCP